MVCKTEAIKPGKREQRCVCDAALDLGATVGLRKWAPLDVNVRATNVLDRDYSEVKGFPVSGRAFTVGLLFAP